MGGKHACQSSACLEKRHWWKTPEVVLVDATETPIERPKKTAKVLLRQEKEAHGKNAGGRMRAQS